MQHKPNLRKPMKSFSLIDKKMLSKAAKESNKAQRKLYKKASVKLSKTTANKPQRSSSVKVDFELMLPAKLVTSVSDKLISKHTGIRYEGKLEKKRLPIYLMLIITWLLVTLFIVLMVTGRPGVVHFNVTGWLK